MERRDKAAEILELSRDLLDDVELGRLTPEQLLLKASRLARLVNDDEKQTWLSYELIGYSADDVGLRYMSNTLRWTDQSAEEGYWQSLPQIEAQIETMRSEMAQLRVPDIHFSPQSANPHELVVGYAGLNVTAATAPIKQVMDRLAVLRNMITTLSAIRSRVLAFVHAFVARIYYEALFSAEQGSIFHRYQRTVDARLAESCGDVLQKFPAVYDRLSNRDPEAISQALNTCRRIIDAFADSIFPARDIPIELEGRSFQVGPQHHQNRILAFVALNSDSKSRRDRLRHSLVDLYDRISAGVHRDVTANEAQSLFLQTYLLLGEILELPAHGKEPAAVAEGEPKSAG